MLPIQKEHPGKKIRKKDAIKCLKEKVVAVEMTLRELLEEMADLGLTTARCWTSFSL